MNLMESSGGVPAVPQCLEWTVEEVADWVESLGFRQYRVRAGTLN